MITLNDTQQKVDSEQPTLTIMGKSISQQKVASTNRQLIANSIVPVVKCSQKTKKASINKQKIQNFRILTLPS